MQISRDGLKKKVGVRETEWKKDKREDTKGLFIYRSYVVDTGVEIFIWFAELL